MISGFPNSLYFLGEGNMDDVLFLSPTAPRRSGHVMKNNFIPTK